MMAPAIPDRWLNYTPIGKRIEGTRFIAFKVPLRERITESVDYDIRLDISGLLRKVPDLGIIIDLTNTNRYYDPEYFRKEGVEHKKLMIPGHVTPPDNLVNQFKLYVLNFLNSNKDNDKLIGVHCTHGVNRTGYLICNYMISEMSMEPKEAIRKFDIARGHRIERINYLEALDDMSKRKSDENRETYSRHRNYDNRDSNDERDLRHSNLRDFRDNRRHYHTHQYHPYATSTGQDRFRDNRSSSYKDQMGRNRRYSDEHNSRTHNRDDSRSRYNWIRRPQ